MDGVHSAFDDEFFRSNYLLRCRELHIFRPLNGFDHVSLADWLLNSNAGDGGMRVLELSRKHIVADSEEEEDDGLDATTELLKILRHRATEVCCVLYPSYGSAFSVKVFEGSTIRIPFNAFLTRIFSSQRRHKASPSFYFDCEKFQEISA